MKVESISVVIPVYNSAENLPELIKQIEPVLADCASAYEVILVNDGSRDQSWQVIEELSEKKKWIQGIDLMRNYGQHNALLCGIRMAQYEITVTIDDDLQHPPAEIPRLLEQLTDNIDVVYGRPVTEQHGLWRDLASQITKWVIQSAMGVANASGVSAFRAFRTYLRNAFASYSNPYVSIDVLLSWGTTRFAAIPVQHNPRFSGESNYTFFKLLTHAINMLTGFSALPLRVASLLGFSSTLLGIGVLIYVVGRYLIMGYSVPGFPFLASTIAIFSGIQLFALGVIGEYLGRIHGKMMERPAYSVQRVVNQINEQP